MRVPVGVLVALVGLSGCLTAPPGLPEPEPTPSAASDAGSEPGPIDAGSAPQADTRPAADPSCPIDRLENDDSPEQLPADRSLMHIYNHGPLKVTGLTACLGDEDWLPAYADCCDAAGATVRWDPAVGPLDVELVDERGVALPPSSPEDIAERQPGEVRLLRAKHGGRFFIRVRASGAASVPYSVDVFAPVYVH